MTEARTVISRRSFLATSAQGALGSACLPALLLPGSGMSPLSSASEIRVEDPDGALGRTCPPVEVVVRLSRRHLKAAGEGRLQVREVRRKGDAPAISPVQYVGGDTARGATLCWCMPEGTLGGRCFRLEESKEPARNRMFTGRMPDGQIEIQDTGKAVLRYVYAENGPGQLLDSISADNRKYAVPRSNYIHPLYGLSGEVLTKDWSIDHPHHRGIYWAWPEVDWRGKRGDLHALQTVFARPTGKCETVAGPVFAQVSAENVWKWEDREPIVQERVVIRVFRSVARAGLFGEHSLPSRLIDLDFCFTAVSDPVLLARRGTEHYGGLNLRLSAVKDQRLIKHTDAAAVKPCCAWSDLSGFFPGAEAPSGLSVLQHAANPDYPGDWIEYPELNWLQPTFPAKGTRFEIRQGKPLVLRFRLLIHAGGSLSEAGGKAFWQAFHSPVTLST